MDTSNGSRYKIKCDCCGTETLAEVRNDKIVIMDRRHGRRHIAVLKLSDLMEIMQMLSEAPVNKHQY